MWIVQLKFQASPSVSTGAAGLRTKRTNSENAMTPSQCQNCAAGSAVEQTPSQLEFVRCQGTRNVR